MHDYVFFFPLSQRAVNGSSPWRFGVLRKSVGDFVINLSPGRRDWVGAMHIFEFLLYYLAHVNTYVWGRALLLRLQRTCCHFAPCDSRLCRFFLDISFQFLI